MQTLVIVGAVIGAVAVMIFLAVIAVLIISCVIKCCFKSDKNIYDLPNYFAMPSRRQTKENVYS